MEIHSFLEEFHRAMGSRPGRHAAAPSLHAIGESNDFDDGEGTWPDSKRKEHIDFLKNSGLSVENAFMAPGTNEIVWGIDAAFRSVRFRYVGGRPARRNEIESPCREASSHGHGPIGEIPMCRRAASVRSSVLPTAHRVSRQGIWLPLYRDPGNGKAPHIVESMVGALQ